MSVSTIPPVTVVAASFPPPDSTARREHAAVTADVALALGIPVPLLGRRFQVRVAVTAPARSAGDNANFTVARILPGSGRVALYPSSAPGAMDGGIYKLFGSNVLPAGAAVALHGRAPSVTTLDGAAFGASFAEPSAGRYFREAVVTGGPRLALLAPHGGHIEEETSDELAVLRGALAVLGHRPAVWDAQGVWGGGQTLRRWHIAAQDINPDSFPGLGHLAGAHAPFFRAVALHGFSWGAESAADPCTWRYGIVIGGRAPVREKAAVMEVIAEAVGRGRISYAIADPAGDRDVPEGPDGSLAAHPGYAGLRGVAEDDLVNRLAPGGGIQLEQSRGVRRTYAAEVAGGLAHALDRILGESVVAAAGAELAAAR